MVRTDTTAIDVSSSVPVHIAAANVNASPAITITAHSTNTNVRRSTNSEGDEIIDVVGSPESSPAAARHSGLGAAGTAMGAVPLAVVFHAECLQHEVPEQVALEVPERLARVMGELDVLALGDLRAHVRLERNPPRIHERWVRAVHQPRYVCDGTCLPALEADTYVWG